MAKILVVDDEPDMIWALTNVLLSENHAVISVNRGEEALDKINQTAVDLVLLDFRLPGMDGLQILEKIKQIKPDLPVIMVTGYGGIEEAVQSVKLGADNYLPKPFDNDRLVELVNKSLQIDHLKKQGIFGQRVAEKIQLPTRSAPHSPTSFQEKSRVPIGGETPAKQRWNEVGDASSFTKTKRLKIAAFCFIALFIFSTSAFFWFYRKNLNQAYPIANSRVSGLSWGGGTLWLCDWYSQNVQQYKRRGGWGGELELAKTIALPGYHLTGIAWGNGFLYSCDSWKKTIFKHYIDDRLSVAAAYPSPGPNPSGLFYDGKYLWSCDGDTRKIYQHLLDNQLTVVAVYASPALFPVGIYHDKKDFWSASAKGMKLFKSSFQESLKLEKTFVFPDSFEIAEQISAFTIEGEKIWIAYEGVNKIFRKDLSVLQEVAP